MTSGSVPVAVAALAVALLVEPARRLLQRGVDRLVFGRKGSRALLRVLREAMTGDQDPSNLVDGVRVTLGVPGLRFEVTDLGVVAESGVIGTDAAELELSVEGTRTGSLFVSARRGESGLRRADRDLLALIEPALGLLAQSMRLAAALANSRRHVVEAAEAERVRLRRDLHDGVASGLAGVRFKLDAARAASPLPALSTVLLDSSEDLRAATEALRIVIDDLRPPELDRLGLGHALRTHWVRPIGRDGETVIIDIECEPLEPDLPPAAEVTAFRIVVEAVTNAIRHTVARRIRVRLDANGASLRILVEDDGGASGPWREGTGLRSMRERAELIGGELIAGPSRLGGLVQARLPIPGDALQADVSPELDRNLDLDWEPVGG